jgi:hypothetical protein
MMLGKLNDYQGMVETTAARVKATEIGFISAVSTLEAEVETVIEDDQDQEIAQEKVVIAEAIGHARDRERTAIARAGKPLLLIKSIAVCILRHHLADI